MCATGANMMDCDLFKVVSMRSGKIQESFTQIGSSFKAVLRCQSTRRLVYMSKKMTYLIDIFVFKCPRPAQRSTQIIVEAVGAPEHAPAAFKFNSIMSAACAPSSTSIQANCKSKMCCCPEQTPAMVYSRLRQEIETLAKPSLNAGQSYFSSFFRKTMFSS